MLRLENIEWTNTWRENATEGTPRVLLIGDSITVGYRSIVNRNLEGALRVTAFATSKSIANPYLVEEIALLGKQEGNAYQVVQFNNGLHGGGLTDAEYAALYEEVLYKTVALFPQARFQLALSTPVSVNGDTASYGERNDQVIRWNDCVRKIGEKTGFPVVDLYSIVYGNKDIRTADGYHYTRDGYELLGRAVADAILANRK